MLNPDLIRQNPDLVREGIKKKGFSPDLVDQWLEVDQQWRELLTKIEQLRAERNQLADQIKQSGRKPTEKELARGKELKKKIQELEEKLTGIEVQRQELLYQIPNLPADDVPVGEDDSENVEIKKWGKPPKFDFQPKDHLEIGEKLGIIDVKRAGKVSGPRFGYLTAEAVLLEFALVQFALKFLIDEGFIPVIPPVMIKKEMELGLGYGEHGGWEDMYLLQPDDLVLVATAEHSLVAMHADEVFNQSELPRRYVGFSTCFRREAGAYGKDTRGIMRVHQFDKVEMVSFARPEDSDKEQEYFLSLEEKLMQALEIPYRVVKMCTGDLAGPQIRRYDLEAWMPGQNRYRETHSCSNCTDYQSRRLNIKFRRKGKLEHVHTINATAYAIGRTIIAILENYQQKDGSVVVPEPLRSWLNKETIKPIS